MSEPTNIAEFSPEGINIGQDQRTLAYLYGLSDFWAFIFDDASKVNLILEASTLQASDIYNKFLQLTSIISLEDISTLTNAQIQLVLLGEADLVPGYLNRYSIPGSVNVSTARCLANRPFLPTDYLEQDADFFFNSDGTLSLAKPIGQYSFPFRTLADGTKQFAIWCIDAKIDDALIYDHYAKLIDISPASSSENFKNFVYGLYYLYVNGPNLSTIKKGLNITLGVPLARDTEVVLETRKYLNTDQYLVITDTNSYLIPYGLEPTVEIGQTLSVGDEISTWAEVKDYINDGEWWINFMLPSKILPHVPVSDAVDPGLPTPVLLDNFRLPTSVTADVTSITRSSTTATVVTVQPHNLNKSNAITIAGAAVSGYNLTTTVLAVVDAYTFTYTVASGLATPQNGAGMTVTGTPYIYSTHTTLSSLGTAGADEGTLTLTGIDGTNTTLTASRITSTTYNNTAIGNLGVITWMNRKISGPFNSTNLFLQHDGTANSGTVTYNESPTTTLKGRRWYSAHISEFGNMTSSVGTGGLLVKPTVGQATGGGVVTTMGPVYSNAAGRPTIVLTFDDSELTQYTDAFPYMKAKGLVGTMFVVPSFMNNGVASSKMTPVQAKEMVDAGWAACCDSTYTDVSVSGNPATALANLDTVRAYLRTNGLAKDGSENHLCWANGVWNPDGNSAVVTYLRDTGGFLTGRTVQGQLNNLITDRFGLGDIAMTYPGCSTSSKLFTSSIKPIVDQAIQRGQTAIFYIHKVRASGTPTSMGIDLEINEFKALIDYIADKKAAGILDVLTVPQWYNRTIGAIVAPTLNRYASPGSYAEYLMKNYLYKHTFLVNIKTVAFKNLQAFTEIAGVIKQVKPTYTTPVYVWTVPIEDEKFSIDDRLIFLSMGLDRCDAITDGIKVFNRDSLKWHSRVCPQFTRRSASETLKDLLGWSPDVNGTPRSFNSGTVTGYIVPQWKFRDYSDQEKAWYSYSLSRNHNSIRNKRSQANMTRSFMTTNNDGNGHIGYNKLYPQYRMLYLYTATRRNIEKIFNFANATVPDKDFFTLFEPRPYFDLINMHELDGEYQDTYYEFMKNKFPVLFSRDPQYNYLGSYFPRASYVQFTPPIDQLVPGDFMAFTHVIGDTFGVFWMTLNTTYDCSPFTFHEINDKLTVSFTSPPMRGMAQVGSPYYLLRDSNAVSEFTNSDAIDEKEIDGLLGDSKIVTRYSDANNNFIMDRSGRLLKTQRIFK